MPSLSSGQLDQRVTIQSATLAADGQGGRPATPVTVATTWASVQPVSTTERLQAQAIGSHVTWRVTMRYRTDVTPLMELRWTPYMASAAKTLKIRGITMREGRPEFLDLDCEEVV